MDRNIPPGFAQAYTKDGEPVFRMALREDAWAHCTLVELRALGERHGVDDVPDTQLRTRLMAMERERGLPDGELLQRLRARRK